MQDNDDRFVFDIDNFRLAYETYLPKVILLCSPNNPTGNSLSVEVLEQILKISKDSMVLLDETYWGFENTDNAYCSRLIKHYPSLVIFRSFSKFFGLAGMRIGYAVCDNVVSHDLFKHREYYLGFNRLASKLCIAAIEDFNYYTGLNDKYRADKKVFYQEFLNNKSIAAYQSDANFILLKCKKEGLAKLIFEELKKSGILIGNFGNNALLKDCLRISLGRKGQNLQVIKKIKKILKQADL